jgi:pimeloyl-ACP methyl ester carboxylesterase
MTVRILAGLAMLLLWVVPVYAQSEGSLVIVSDTITEWFNEDTAIWLPAVFVTRESPLWPQIEGARWIWNHPIATVDQKENGEVVEFRRRFELPENMKGVGTFLVAADNEVTASLNGEILVNSFVCNFGNVPSSSCIVEVAIEGQPGENLLEFTVTQFGVPGTGSNLNRNLAGFVFKVTFEKLTEVPADKPDPIVIVPGMLASLNPLTTFLDQPSDLWIYALGARGYYSSLIQQFEASGFLENRDVFTAHYDWRKPVAENVATYLKPVIDQAKSASVSGKVDIVAHSMGGLLARSYIQGEDYENDIDQLITLGTPHLGAADAYVAWEGGDFPTTWSGPLKAYINAIDFSLRKISDLDLQKPLSFRTFFPSLKDLLPITDFVAKDSDSISVFSLTEQNAFLQALQVEINQLEQRGVDVAAIIGTGVSTLGSIGLTDSRTPQDEVLDRWRDGHPAIEPIAPNTSEGDQRVLTESAQLGQKIITLPGVSHDKLPHTARKEILELLGIQPEVFQYEPPDIQSLFGIAVLSPVDPEITCGNETLSQNQNTFGEDFAQYVADPAHPGAPKLLVIGNPPQGECDITLTGTGEGEYTIITTYADEDEAVSTTREGETKPGQTESYRVKLSQDSFTPPTEDVVNLICKLPDKIRDLMFGRHLKPKAFKLHGIATRLCSFAENWEKEINKKEPEQKNIEKWENRTRSDYNQFSQELDTQIAQNNLDAAALKELVNWQIKLEEAGWL